MPLASFTAPVASETGTKLRKTAGFDEQFAPLNPLGWYVARPQDLTLVDGRVAGWKDRSAAGKNIVQTIAAKQPLFVAGDGTIKGRPFLRFEGDTGRNEFLNTPIALPVDPNAKWSKVALVRPLDEQGPNALHEVMSGKPTGNAHRLAYRGINNFRAFCGVSGAQSLATTASVIPGVWRLVISSWDAATFTNKVRTGGLTVSNTTPGASVTDPSLAIGGVWNGGFGWRGDMADLMPFPFDLLDPANAEALAIVLSYYASSYGITG